MRGRDIESEESLPSLLKTQRRKKKGRERGLKEGGQVGGWEERKGAGVRRGKMLLDRWMRAQVDK